MSKKHKKKTEWWSDVCTPVELTETDLQDAWTSPSGVGDLAYTWDDKPHRVVYMLLRHINFMQEQAYKQDQPK